MGANCCKTEAQEEKLTQDQHQQPGDNVSQEKNIARPVDSMHSIKTRKQSHYHKHNLSKASDASSSMYYSCAGEDAKKLFAPYAQEEGQTTGNPYETRSRFSTYAKKMGGLPESSLDAQVFDGTQYRDRQENEISISKLGDSEGVSMSRNGELDKDYLVPPTAYHGQILQHPDLQQSAHDDDDDDDEFFEPKSHMSEMAESRFSERPRDVIEFEVPQNDENDVSVAAPVEYKEEEIENTENLEENKITSPTLEIDVVKEENYQNTQQEDIDTCDPKVFPSQNFDVNNAEVEPEQEEEEKGEAFLSQASVSDPENRDAAEEITETAENQNEIHVEQNKVEITA